MRTLILFCVLSFAVCVAGAQTGWIRSMPPTPHDTYSLHFIDTSYGWVAGASGYIGYSTDVGVSWSAQTSGTTKDLWCVHFTDPLNGWVVGDTVLHTTNGGANWIPQSIGMRKLLRSVFFVDANIGWAVGEAGTVLHTTNGGTNWIAQTSNTTQFLYSVHFAGPLNGGAVGWSGTILRTTNGGSTWTVKTLPSTGQLNAVQFIDANNGWIAGLGRILHTTDGGTTWNDQTIPTSPPPPDPVFYGVSFVDANHGWVSGGSGGLLRTTDGGSTWTLQLVGNSVNWEIHMYSTSIGWIAAGNYIYYTRTGGVIVSVDESKQNGVPLHYALDQNYPNPFNPSTTICYGLPRKSFVHLAVFNPLGQRVAVLQNGEQEAGNHEVKFDGKGFSSGVYFYRIQVRPLDSAIGRDSKSGAESFTETKKLLMIR